MGPPSRSEVPTLPLAATALQGPLDLPVGVALRDVAALVDRVLAAGEGELDLRAALLPVEPRRNEREAALLDLAGQRLDLAPVQQELAVAIGVVGVDARLLVRRDVCTHEPH